MIKANMQSVFCDEQVELIKVTVSTDYNEVSYHCFLEKNEREKQVVKVGGTTPVITQEVLQASTTPVYITFEGFVGKIYYAKDQKKYNLSCKAEKAVIVKPTPKPVA